MVEVAVQSRCHRCIADKLPKSDDALLVCNNYDEECRHIGESFGFYTFAWKPKRCRNGRLRWLTWVDRHDDGTFTLGNRAR